MKVLLCVRGDYYRNFAADSLQAIKLYKYFKSIGVEADINTGDICDFSEYDIIHLFDLNNAGEAYKYYKIASSYKKPIVITPNYWSMTKYYEFSSKKDELSVWKGCRPYRNEILKRAKKILVSSEIEKRVIKRDFNIKRNLEVVYSGVAVESKDVPLYNFKDRYDLNNYVLCVGKICEIKNQLALAELCNKLNIDFVMIGSITDKKYFKKCMEYENVKYFGFVDSYNLYNAYKFATIYVAPGFRELPGISTLEAAATGCRIIASSEGCVKEYLGEDAIYFNPYDLGSLERAMEFSKKLKKPDELSTRILEEYSWDKFGENIYSIYKEVCETV